MALDRALQMLDIQKQALTAGSFEDLTFILLNKPHDLVAYDQAVYWSRTLSDPVPKEVSGNADLDPNGPYAQCLKSLIKAQHKKNETDDIIKVGLKDLEQDLREKVQDIIAPYGLVLVFKTQQEGPLGGIWLERNTPFHDSEIAIMQEFVPIFSQALALQKRRAQRYGLTFWRSLTRYKKLFWLGLFVVALWPVRLSITAPAEIVSQDPGQVAAPFEGIIEDVLVRSGDKVTDGQILALMEHEALESQMDKASRDLDLARTQLSRLSREALASPERKAEIEGLRAEIELKQIEYDFAQQKLQQTQLTAPKGGTVIAADVQGLVGRPVSAGQRLMQVADPEKAELLVRVSMRSMLQIDKDTKIRFFLNVSPLSGYEAQIISIGYQASPDPNGLLTYKIRASLAPDIAPRLGWQGTAKIYGDWSIMAYAILRRPLISLRSFLGI